MSRDRDHADVVIIGAGASGLSLAHALATGGPPRSVTLLEAPDGPLRPPERTWCFWEEGVGAFDEAVPASWQRLRVHGPDGHPIEGSLGSLRYKMLRSSTFEELVSARLAGLPHVRRLIVTAHEVRSGARDASVMCTTPDGCQTTVRGRLVYDSRPLRPLPPARTTLLQHFRGWFVRTEDAMFDPAVADLMDFRVPQPGHGLAFGYVLPLGPREALVEYTQFSRTPLSRQAYEAALQHYTSEVLRLGPLEVTAAEQGVIPMTDARFDRRVAPAAFRIGAASGATRPATGYTFSAVQRQTRDIANALRAGRQGIVPAPWSRRALAMDAVMLRALDTGRIDGPAFFATLFRRTPFEQLLRFLDGRTSLTEDLRIGFATPVWPMLRTSLELPFLTRRRARDAVDVAAGRRGTPLPREKSS